ncbi:GNAT family N-acetyltransferase [Streptomyces sp. NPDC127106]|uniref:GNAT family N-acetyltransferase n=1 Tax=Streptomyces sp. NPDC127106 TaxID=3345360 RepID=UPI00363650F7
MASGELRARPLGHYLAHTDEFLLVEDTAGRPDGCVVVRDEGPGVAVLRNFPVARGGQGRGLGPVLLRAALARARRLGAARLFTATVGSAELFLRHGFVPVDPERAPAAWASALDPDRGARVHLRKP